MSLQRNNEEKSSSTRRPRFRRVLAPARSLAVAANSRLHADRPRTVPDRASRGNGTAVGAGAFQEALRVPLPRSPRRRERGSVVPALPAAPPCTLDRFDDDAHAPIDILNTQENGDSSRARSSPADKRGRATDPVVMREVTRLKINTYVFS